MKNTHLDTVSMEQISVVNKYFAISLNKCNCLYGVRYKIYIKPMKELRETVKEKLNYHKKYGKIKRTLKEGILSTAQQAT